MLVQRVARGRPDDRVSASKISFRYLQEWLMSTVSCSCGTLVSMPEHGQDVTVACPNCGRTVVKGVSMGFAPPSQLNPSQSVPESNGAATIGFVLGLLGLFTCAITAPFAVFFSIRGLSRPQNRGLAITGLILGILQSIALIGTIIYFLVMALLLGSAAVAVGSLAANSDQLLQRVFNDQFAAITYQVLSDRASDIKSFEINNQRMPNQEELQQFAVVEPDAWGRAIILEVRENAPPLLMSLGNDGKRDTEDDIVYDWANPLSLPRDTPFPGLNRDSIPSRIMDRKSSDEPPSDPTAVINSALEDIRRGGILKSMEASEALVSMPVDPSQRGLVVNTALENWDNFGSSSDFVEVMKHWLAAEQAPACVDAIQTNRSSQFPYRELVELLFELGQTELLVPLCNHEKDEVRRAIRGSMPKQPEIQSLLVNQCLKDLANSKRLSDALELLAQLPVIESLRTEVALAMNPFLESEESHRAFEVLRLWGGCVENIPILKRQGRAEVIATIRDPQALVAISELLSDTRRIHSAIEAFEKIGPAAESYVWPALESNSVVTQVRLIQLLGRIGTEQSIAKLEAIRSGNPFESDIMKAIEEIRNAKRAPESW